MKWTNKTGTALLIITLGMVILLGKIGWLAGSMTGWIIPITFVLLGYYGVKNGRSWLGWILILIGGIVLLGKLSGFFIWFIAIGLIWYGVRMLRNRPTL